MSLLVRFQVLGLFCERANYVQRVLDCPIELTNAAVLRSITQDTTDRSRKQKLLEFQLSHLSILKSYIRCVRLPNRAA